MPRYLLNALAFCAALSVGAALAQVISEYNSNKLQGYLDLYEAAAPATPPADRVRLYAKDNVGTSELYYKNDAGAERNLSATGGGLPTGAIVLVASGSCPVDYTEVVALNGKFLLGTLNASADVGTTGGANDITPAGTVSQPTFTGNALAGHQHTYTDVVNHTHTVDVTDPGHVHTLPAFNHATGSASNKVEVTNSATGNSASANSNTTGITAATQNPAGGVATGNTASVGAGTPTGTVSTPTFTGTQFDNRPAFVRVIFCQKD